MTQKIEDALRRMEAQAATMVAKDDVAIIRAHIAELQKKQSTGCGVCND